MKMNLVRPCAKCPFRKDVPGYLRGGRAVEIAAALANGATFACHETTVESEDEDVGLEAGPDSQFCAGALILMERQDAPNQYVRVAERLGQYDPNRLDLTAAVFSSYSAFVDHHRDAWDEEEQECCSVCETGCLAPAGYMIDGVAVPAEPEGDVHDCPECGQPVCENCSADGGICIYCNDWNEDTVPVLEAPERSTP